ncbi:MAG: XdhC/CoxI family protein [Pseudomonadota bacterium]
MKKPGANIVERLASLLRGGTKAALATVVRTGGSTPRETGAKMIVLADGGIEGTIGGGILEKKVIDDAMAMMKEGAAGKLVHYRLLEEEKGGIGAACGGDCDVFVEVFAPGRRILVCGGGHVGLSVARIGADAGFEVTVVDDRPEITGGREPAGVTVLLKRPDDPAVRGEVNESTAVVIVTRGHELDREALRSLINAPAFYIGMIGSRRKVGAVLSALEKEGVSRELLESVFTPIGLDIGAETPEEIALAIVAEIVAVAGTGKPSSISMKHGRKRDGA